MPFVLFPNVGRWFSPSASPWSDGRWSVGLAYCFVFVGVAPEEPESGGVAVGVADASEVGTLDSEAVTAGRDGMDVEGNVHLVALLASAADPQSDMLQPKKLPDLVGSAWSQT